MEATARFVAKWEAFRSKVYRDVGGVETIGYGETDRAFIDRYRSSGVSQPVAWEQLKKRILEFNRQMRALLGPVPLTANQEGALTSLVYNIGQGSNDARLAGWHDSPVLAALRQNPPNYALAAEKFTHHNKVKGKVVNGLTNRRKEEAIWFRSGTPSVVPGKPGIPSFDEVRVAFEKWRGFVEGPRSNECPFNDWYYGRKVTGAAYPWCAAFVSYVLFHAGMPVPATTTKGFVYTPSGAAWFQKRSRWTRKPTVGALSFYDWGTRIAHVGWVVKVDPDGSFWAWEGNTDVKGGRTGGRVLLQHRSAASIGKRGGFGLLEYGQAVAEDEEEDVRKRLTFGIKELGKVYVLSDDMKRATEIHASEHTSLGDRWKQMGDSNEFYFLGDLPPSTLDQFEVVVGGKS